MSESAFVRSGVRALVIDTEDRVLLVRFELPGGDYWTAPGGGIESGESDHAALERELAEETGLVGPTIGPLLWSRLETFPNEPTYAAQEERFFLVRTEPFHPRPQLSWEELHQEFVTAVRWWRPEELARADVLFAPRELARLAIEIIASGPPPAPLDLGTES